MESAKKIEGDLLDRGGFMQALDQLISMECQLAGNDSFVMCLDGSYGSGKSWFVNEYKKHCEERGAGIPPQVIIINAWELDYCADPMVAIVDAISCVFPKDEEKEKLAEKCDWAVSAIAASGQGLAARFIGLDLLRMQEVYIERKADSRPKSLPATKLMHDARAKMRELREMISSGVRKLSSPVYIIIDELDRCRPDYAISYLETIKHLFCVERVVFIIAADRAQLSSAAKAVFGSELNFDEYFRKFVRRSVRLPEVSSLSHSCIHNMIRGMADKSWCALDGSPALESTSNPVIDNMTSMALLLNPTMRQLHEAMRMTRFTIARMNHYRTAPPAFTVVRCFFMSLLSFRNRPLYDALGRNEPRFAEVARLVLSARVTPKSGNGQLIDIFEILCEGFDITREECPKLLKDAVAGFNLKHETIDTAFARMQVAASRDPVKYNSMARMISECSSFGGFAFI